MYFERTFSWLSVLWAGMGSVHQSQRSISWWVSLCDLKQSLDVPGYFEVLQQIISPSSSGYKSPCIFMVFSQPWPHAMPVVTAQARAFVWDPLRLYHPLWKITGWKRSVGICIWFLVSCLDLIQNWLYLVAIIFNFGFCMYFQWKWYFLLYCSFFLLF